MREIYKIVLNNFSEYIKISDKRQLKPFLKGKKKLPKKYQTEEFGWDNKNRLISRATGLPIASNPLVCGKPRYWRINGQDIFNQKVKLSQRASIMNKLHNIFEPLFKSSKKITEGFPLKLQVNFYVLDEGKRNIDNDNKWIYEKSILDSMTNTGFIPDDSPLYVNENGKKTIFVEDNKDTRLEIILYDGD